MAARFADTKKTIDGGLENAKPDKAVHLIEDWEASLSDTEVSGAKGILKGLESLKMQLEKDEPDAERVKILVSRLGDKTSKIAERADKNGDKLKDLGQSLTTAGS